MLFVLLGFLQVIDKQIQMAAHAVPALDDEYCYILHCPLCDTELQDGLWFLLDNLHGHHGYFCCTGCVMSVVRKAGMPRAEWRRLTRTDYRRWRKHSWDVSVIRTQRLMTDTSSSDDEEDDAGDDDQDDDESGDGTTTTKHDEHSVLTFNLDETCATSPTEKTKVVGSSRPLASPAKAQSETLLAPPRGAIAPAVFVVKPVGAKHEVHKL